MAAWYGPYLQTPDRGYAVKSPPSDPEFGNASLQDSHNDYIRLKITEISTDFSIQGKYAQSMRKRDFMPHSIVQPALRITGQCSNQFQHARIGEFVRHCQQEVLDPTNTDPKQTLVIDPPRGLPQGRTIKGRYSAYWIQGWVKQIMRGGVKHEFAPEYTLVFQIGAILGGLGVGDNEIGQPDPENKLFEKAQWEAFFHLNDKQFTPPGAGQPGIPPPLPPPPPPPTPAQALGLPPDNLSPFH